MKTLHEMKKKRDTIARQMRALNDKAKDEKRALSAEESTQWDNMRAEHEQLSTQIEREEELRAMETRETVQQQNRDTPDAEDEQRQAELFGVYVRQGLEGMTMEQRQELRALNSVTGSAGGFTVPTQFRNRVVEAMKAYGGLANICQVINTDNGAPMQWIVTDGTGEIGEMMAENDEATKADPSFGNVLLGAKKGSSKIILVPNELLQDNSVGLDALLARRIASRLGRLEAHQILQGDGLGNNVNGLLKQITAKYTAATASAVAYEDLVELKHSVDPAYRTQGKYLFNDGVFKGLKLLKDAQGRPLWLPAVSGVAPATIDGDEYQLDQGMQAPGTGNISVAYGDFQSVILRRVAYMNLRRLTERYAEFDQMGFVGFHRFDVLLEDKAAVKGLVHGA